MQPPMLWLLVLIVKTTTATAATVTVLPGCAKVGSLQTLKKRKDCQTFLAYYSLINEVSIAVISLVNCFIVYIASTRLLLNLSFILLISVQIEKLQVSNLLSVTSVYYSWPLTKNFKLDEINKTFIKHDFFFFWKKKKTSIFQIVNNMFMKKIHWQDVHETRTKRISVIVQVRFDTIS